MGSSIFCNHFFFLLCKVIKIENSFCTPINLYFNNSVKLFFPYIKETLITFENNSRFDSGTILLNTTTSTKATVAISAYTAYAQYNTEIEL